MRGARSHKYDSGSGTVRRQRTECKVILTFFEFCIFGEPWKPEPEQGSMARAGRQVDPREGATTELQETAILGQCKIPTGPPEIPAG